MSLFLNNLNNYEVDPENIKIAEVQYDSMTLLYTQIIKSCKNKCINPYSDSEISKGEGCCLDRCVSKYMEANTLVGLKFKEHNVDPLTTNAAIMATLGQHKPMQQ